MEDFLQKAWSVLVIIILLQCTIKVVHYNTDKNQ